MTPATVEYSAQELAILTGQPIVHGTVSDRVLRLHDAVRTYGPCRVSLDRAIAFTASFIDTEGQPLVLRWAKALKHYAETAPIAIFPDELIVGRPNTWLGKWGIVYPELDGEIMPAGVALFRNRKWKHGEVVVTAEDEDLIEQVLTPYWAGKDYAAHFARALPEDTRFTLFGPDPANIWLMTAVIVATSTMRHSQNWTPDFSKLLTRGTTGIRQEAVAKLASLSNPHDQVHKRPFLEAVMMTCDAMVIWSRRYAALSRDLAATEQDGQRATELLEIAEVCDWVPENPARTFREAIQSQWWGQMFNRIELTSGSLGQGRMDQYLLPYYRTDLAAGRVTEQSATELFHCLWLNMQQCVEIRLNPVAAAGMEGFSKFEDVVLGGQTPDGRDATNELTYLILESTRALAITAPEPCVRIHANTPDRLLHYVADVIKDGKGVPKLLNDERVVPFYIANGAAPKEALDWVVSGCMESRLINRETNVTVNGGINYGAVIEMTFRNGRLKVFTDLQFGKAVGNPREWTSFDQVWRAYTTQLVHVVTHAMIQQYVALQLKPQFVAAPQSSMLHDLAMEACRDLHTHGDWIPGAIDHSCVETIGKGTAIDSLAAVKHLIFDTRRVTWDQLLTAMEANWEGHETIRQLCVNAPKYGNGIEWVDDIGFQNDTFLLEFLKNHPKPNGQRFLLRGVPITFHVPMGKVTWATPDGRRAQEYLTEGLVAGHGRDVHGPTVAMTSYARAMNLSYAEKGPELMDMTFTPAMLAGDAGTQRLMRLIRTWCNLKHWHIQFNVINTATLLAAQKDPEKHRRLIVRIAGNSAYFVDLSPTQQAEIIARTEQPVDIAQALPARVGVRGSRRAVHRGHSRLGFGRHHRRC